MSKSVDARARSLDGPALLKMLEAGAAQLEGQVHAVNALNVFPVPDGDTGTNMLLTIRSSLKDASEASPQTAAEALAEVSRGSLMGARGNSGVILSQILRGFKQAAEGRDLLTGGDLREGFRQAAPQAYRAVSEPVEGTLLTVAREVAEALETGIGEGEPSLEDVLGLAVEAARAAVARTPFQLAVLRENGVVDAGGQGFALLLEGWLAHLRGEAPSAPTSPAVVAPALHDGAGTEGRVFGYCAEYLLEGASAGVAEIRARMMELGDSVIVVEDGGLTKVHLHTETPATVRDYLAARGSVAREKLDDIDAQHEEFAAVKTSVPGGEVAVIAVAAGAGFAATFRSLGVAEIVPGGQTMNPSTQDIVSAIEAAGREEVIVLPNNDNVIPCAQQAAEMAAGHRVSVLPTRDMPQGVAAMMSYNYEAGLEDNMRYMTSGRDCIKTGEVTRAVRDASMGGREAREGQAIALAGGELVAAEDDLTAALLGLLHGLGADDESAITIYWGADVPPSDARQAVSAASERFPGADVQAVEGGQPHYPYLVSIE